MKRREGLAKLTGRERYVDDLRPSVDGRGRALWAATVRSSVARGRIRSVRFDPAIDWDAFVVVDHRDIPGRNVVKLIADDQPVLAADRVRHVHEPILLLAHPSRSALRRAVRAVTIDIEPESPIFDVCVPPTPEQVQHGTDHPHQEPGQENVFKRLAVDKGDVDAAFAAAAHIVDGTYATGSQEHVYLEPQGVIAHIEGEGDDDVVVVSGSMQCPFYVQGALMMALDREAERVRVVQTSTGGGFGGKEEFPSGLAIHAALLALKARRPVKLIYDRGEDLEASTKRHPSWVRHRTALDADGRLLAQDIDIVMDAGAYVTLSPVVLSRGVIHAAGPYRCANVRIRGRCVLSNRVPFGAFRGFGAPQTLFACERHMDRIAHQLGLDPVSLRRVNLLRDGDSTATSQTIRDGSDRSAVIDQALAMAGWYEKRAAHRAFNATEPWLRRGIGLAVFHHGAGFTGSGEVYLDSRVAVAGLPDGRVEVLTAATEMGQGTITVFTQLAADRLGLPPEDVLIAQPDTARVPDSGPTVASRTAMIVGRLVERACDDLRDRLGLGPEASSGDAVRRAIIAWHEDYARREQSSRDETRDGGVATSAPPLLGQARYQAPPGVLWDDERYRGDAYGAFAWATYVAEVEVDLRTYSARVIDFVAVQEIGKVLNEVLARGQIQGGVVQGIGWALSESFVWRDGAMANAQLTNYVIPTSDDVPSIRVAFQENPYPHGAQGAKGIGELPMDGPGPAIANAIAAALDVDPCEIPLTPETLMDLIDPIVDDASPLCDADPALNNRPSATEGAHGGLIGS